MPIKYVQFFIIVGIIFLLEMVAGSLILVNAEKASQLLSQSMVSSFVYIFDISELFHLEYLSLQSGRVRRLDIT